MHKLGGAMRKAVRTGLLGLSVVLLLTPAMSAQNPTGTVTGKVSDSSDAALPGVTVTATASTLLGERTTVTSVNGDYKLGLLPPGEYTITYMLEGFEAVERTVKVSVTQTHITDVAMGLEAVTEEIIVTSNTGTISETNTVAQTTTQAELEALPVLRTPLNALRLVPGSADTGPASSPSILGGFSYENLYLINGIEINENIRGTFLPLFIEDAIQETTTQVAGVSAEYGRFAGGVVNVITKSGGNNFHGSVRNSYVNDKWISADTDLKFNEDFERTDDRGEITEVTLGGPIWKDRIWFFGAGRDLETTGTGTTVQTNISFPTGDEERREELKATISITPSHTLQYNNLTIERSRAGATFGSILDLRSVNIRTDPQEIQSFNYTGILTSSFFLEAQVSERDLEIATGFGGPPDLINGTLMRDRPTGRVFWSSVFCGSCEAEIRNNEDQLIKGSYFLSTKNLGSHDIVFGYDNFSDIRFSVNHQSGSDFQVWAETTVQDGANNIFPVFTGGRTWIVWWPPFGLDIAQPTDFETNSLFVNDSWQLNDKWSFNVGVRYDENDGVDSSGATVSDDSKVSPRLGMSYDVKGDGDLVFNASYGTYVAAIANTGNVADKASTGGALGGFFSFYGGPSVNAACTTSGANCVTTDVALNTLFNWYFGNGGTLDAQEIVNGTTTPPGLFYSSIPGVSNVVRQSIKSPSVDELTVGVTKRLGRKGLIRADVVQREWTDFYSQRNTPGDIGAGSDISEIGNFGNNILSREYTGILVSGRYRVTNRFTLAGNFTKSALKGNINGETGGSGPVSASPNQYPEYEDPAWSRPVGKLSADQEHKLTFWGIYQIFDREHHQLSVSLLQNLFSGTPYGAIGNVDTTFVFNPGYAQPPTETTYFFTGRDAFNTGTTIRTDVSLNYSFLWNLWGQSFEVFLQPEVINLFDEQGLGANRANTDILDATLDSSLSSFNPFTDTPVQGVNWEKGPEFGQADAANDFQQPRTFRFSVGFRF